ncbi:MAG: ATP-binding protein [Magnetospirillum sp.]|nr:ATP-binding protein [Magnetospirillum sp.]
MSDLFRDAFAALACPAAILDRAGRFVEVNGAFVDAVGRDAALLAGKPATDILHNLPAAFADRRHDCAILLHHTEAVSVRMACTIVPMSGGTAMLTLRASPELAGWPYQLIVEAIEEGITIRAADGRIIGSNRAARALLGPTGAPDFIRWDGEPLAQADHPAFLALASGNPVAGIIGARKPDGTVRWLQVHSVPIHHPEAGHAVVSSFAEINQLVDTQRRLADSERRFRAIFDQTYEFIGLLDTEGHLIEANATALAFIDKGLDEIAGLPFAETPWWTHSPAEQTKLRDGIARAAVGEFVRFETSHAGPNGHAATIDFSLKPAHDDNGKVIYIIPEGRDITHLKRAEEALMAAKLEAEAANHAKSAFLASVSHELRTPLNAVIGFSETIQHQVFGPLGNARYAEYVGLIHSAGSHLRDIIEDILDVARIEIGEVTLREEDMDLGECLSGLVRMMSLKAEERRVSLTLVAPAELPRLHADPLRIRQVVLNLLSNAVKFTPPQGSVHLSAAVTGDGLEISVTDTGIGIRPEDMDSIWKPFFQADASLSRRFGGTGLGLPIVRHYVEAHGGAVTVDSIPGKGSAFTVRLPAGRLVRPANDAEPQGLSAAERRN